jgi:hypothetical protein
VALHLKASFYARPNIITRFYEKQTIAFGKNNALRAQKHGLALRHRLWQKQRTSCSKTGPQNLSDNSSLKIPQYVMQPSAVDKRDL